MSHRCEVRKIKLLSCFSFKLSQRQWILSFCYSIFFHNFDFHLMKIFTRGTTALTHSWNCTRNYGKCLCVCVILCMKMFSLQLAIFWPEKSKRKLNEFDDFWFQLGSVCANMLLLFLRSVRLVVRPILDVYVVRS